MIEHQIDRDATPKAAGENGTSPKSDDVSGTYTPYQPALDAGISEEMDRLNFRRIQLAKRKSRGLLTPAEDAEFEQLQDTFFAYIETIFPGPPVDDRLEKLEAKYLIQKNP